VSLDVTVSGTSANSYASLVEATEYHAGRTWSDEWAAATDAKREAALRYATSLIDRLDFVSDTKPAIVGQRLRWPRLYAWDMDGERLPVNVIPRPILDACCELAYYLLVDDRNTETGVPEFKSLSVAGIGIEFNVRDGYRDTTVKPVLPRSVVDILRPYLVGYGQTRLRRG
jgi:hypothetical protein